MSGLVSEKKKKKKPAPTHLLSVTMGVESAEATAGLPLAELTGLWVELSGVDMSLPVEPFRCCILRFLLDKRLPKI